MANEQHIRQQLQKQFDALLKDLNEAQLRAVKHLEGPALVIAGPGTGKTHLVATRIANILVETDTPAQSILCLTFSDAGAIAMRNRLLKFIGTDAHKITVSTYHAFCSRIIAEHPEFFAKGREMQLLSDLERSEWLEELLAQLPQKHPFFQKFKSSYSIKDRLMHLFGVMKRERWTPAWMTARIEERIKAMLTDPEFRYKKKTGGYQAGDLKQASYDHAVEKLQQLQAGVKLYAQWQKILTDNNRYEFDDMVVWVVEALEKHKQLKAYLQERYLYLVVDEYQDTNEAQNQLVQLLIDYWDEPNILIVGDDDQSIYEFQGARLQNLMEFYQQYRAVAEVVVLEENYRSGQPILDAAKRVIDHNQLRALPLLGLGSEKQLRARQTYAEEPEVHVFENEFAELHWIRERVEQCLAAGVEPQEIAVIYRNNKEGERIGAVLRQAQIAYAIKKDIDVFKLPLVRQVISLIEWLCVQLRAPLSADALMFQLLHAPFWELKPLDLALLLAHKRSTASEKSLRQLLQDKHWLHDAGISDPEAVHRVSSIFEQLVADAATLPLLRFWTALLNQTGLLAWCMRDVQSIYWVQVVHTFTVFLEEEVRRKPDLRFDEIPALLQNMQKIGAKLPLIATAQSERGVQLMTAHSSKGLEFDTVLVTGCTKATWQDGQKSNRKKFAFPPNITYSGEEDNIEAQRRLFYVAMTRAKRNLWISFSRRDIKLKDQQAAEFVLETELPHIETSVEPENVALCQVTVMQNEGQLTVHLPRTEAIKNFVENYRLSMSGLNQYLRCPLAFYYEQILKLPDVPSDAAQFGSLMHAALEQFFQMRNAAKQPETVGLSALQNLFRRQMESQQFGFASVSEYRHKLEYGLKCLETYYHQHLGSLPKKVWVEHRIDRVTIDGVPVTGKIDRIDGIGANNLRVVDYKTGENTKAKLAEPDTEQEPYGGDYYRQGLFYKLLTDAAPHLPGVVSEVVFHYLEPENGKCKVHKMDLNQDALNWMRNLIRNTWQNIQSMQFGTGCGTQTCVYCNLHRTGQLDAERLEPDYALDD